MSIPQPVGWQVVAASCYVKLMAKRYMVMELKLNLIALLASI